MRRVPLKRLVLLLMTPAIALSTAGLGYAAYIRLQSTILEGFDRKLGALSAATSAYIDTDETLALLAEKDVLIARGQDPEQHPTYIKYVRPMRRIRERAGLTFLYTQVLLPRQDRQCVYVLDGSVGEGHSPLGSIDTIPEADWDVALRVLHDGEVAQTAIRPWEQWGLLKCGWAPMIGADGRIKAMAGADVEITVIRQKTYVALLQVFGAGALALVLASLVSVRVARTLTQPLGSVREAALRIASGDHRVRCDVEHPHEMRTLAGTVNSLAGAMEKSVADSERRMEAWRQRHAERALLERLSLPPYRSDGLDITPFPGTHASGYVVSGPLALVWEGRQEPDEVGARKTARDVGHVAERLLVRHGHAAAGHLLSLLGGRVLGAAVLDVHRWSIDTCGSVLVVAAQGRGEATGSHTAIAPGASVAVATAGADQAIDPIDTALPPQAGGIAAVLHRSARPWEEPDA